MMENQPFVFWLKQKEIEALEKAAKYYDDNEIDELNFWTGKAVAFGEAWKRALFGRRIISQSEYNRANDEWSKMANRNLSGDG